MKQPKFTEEQIAFDLRQAKSRTRVVEVCRKMDISEQTCLSCHSRVTKSA
jgi:putative transposase